MLIEVFIFDRYGRFAHARGYRFRVDDKSVITSALIFPEKFIVAVVILSDSSLDALRQCVRVDLVEIFAEISEKRSYTNDD